MVGGGKISRKKALRKNVPQAGGRRIIVVACAIALTALTSDDLEA